jgi:serine/threonine protein kinase
MDWGLARSLPRGRPPGTPEGDEPPPAATPETLPADPVCRTIAGTVLGTPAYMPPEQARGQVDGVDERSDVFALGAILCAILTGRPPYAGTNAHEVLRQAKDGDLRDALGRLTAATAELAEIEEAVEAGPLLDLARRCLAPDPGRRPAHAGEVAVLVRAARSKIQNYHLSAQIDRAVEGVRREQRSVVQAGMLSVLGCGVRILFVAAVGVLAFLLLGPCQWR